jgi:hypothetical protein
MLRRIATCVAILLLVGGTAAAVEPTDYGHTGGYLGVNGGYAFDNSEDASLFSVQTMADTGLLGILKNRDIIDSQGLAFSNSDLVGLQNFSSGTVSAWAGYRLDQLVGVEVQGEYNYGFSEIAAWDLIFNFNWYPLQWWLPGNRFQPFLVTGIGFMVAKPHPNRGTAVNGAFRLGGGLDFYFLEHWSVRFKAEWVTGVGKLSGARYAPISLGIQYNF